MAVEANIIGLLVNGERYDVDLADIDGLEWRDMKRVTGMTSGEIVAGALAHDDFEALAALIWIWRRRSGVKETYESVLGGMKLSVFGDQQEYSEATADPPD